MAPTVPTPEEGAPPPKRGRGRPPTGSATKGVTKKYVPTGRPRGRPKGDGPPKAPYVPTGRPRGRPPGSGKKKRGRPGKDVAPPKATAKPTRTSDAATKAGRKAPTRKGRSSGAAVEQEQVQEEEEAEAEATEDRVDGSNEDEDTEGDFSG